MPRRASRRWDASSIRNYLGAIGWTGIRQRKLHLEELLRIAIADRRAQGGPVRVLDVAAGHGRYVLDAIAKGEQPDTILLRDYIERNVEQGDALIRARRLDGIAAFERGDAFDRANLAAIAPHPTIGIVSGLYELFPDNAMVRRSLAGLADAIEDDGPPDLHRAAVASAARAHRPRPHEPPRRRMGHAAADANGARPARRKRGIPQDRPAHRPVGHLHGLDGASLAAMNPGRPWKRAIGWLLFLGPFFFLSYGFANWLASLRASVPVAAFEWERAIPFHAWTIVPYWSIDAFYALSLFVCATRTELDTHAKRLLTAQLVAIACFIAFPLRFSFERPAAEGISGAMFNVLAGFDLPTTSCRRCTSRWP
jgi:hypothetical protein